MNQSFKLVDMFRKLSVLDKIEWVGCLCAMAASYMVASQTYPGIGFIFYMISCGLIGYVCLVAERYGILFLQGYFVIINGIGIYNYLILPNL